MGVCIVYLGKGIRLSTYRIASESVRVDYIHPPRSLAHRPFSELEGHQEATMGRLDQDCSDKSE